MLQTQIQNRLTDLFEQRQKPLLSLFYTAGYPRLGDTLPILKAIERAGADFVEIGMPYSDPLADGATIQASSVQALDNGMTLDLLFEQLAEMRREVSLPVVLMGYYNPVLQYGVERFLAACAEVGVDGLILPDLPLAEYEAEWQPRYEAHGLCNIMLVTPRTPESRIRRIDAATSGFLYAVSSASTTGSKQLSGVSDYLEGLAAMELQNPIMTGFNVRDRESFRAATGHTRGAIVGSAFVRLLGEYGVDADRIETFVAGLKSSTL